MRYVTIRRTRSEDDWMDEPSNDRSITVHDDDDPIPTGVLDMHGNELHRVPETVRMGFVTRF